MNLIMLLKGKTFAAALLVTLILSFNTFAKAAVTVSPSSVNFGAQPLGTASTAAKITLTNNGWRYVTFTGAYLRSTQFSYSGPTGNFTLRPGQILIVGVSFRPTIAQMSNGTLTFTRNNGTKYVVFLSGTGTAATPTSAPPLITSQPANKTVSAGQTATFAVTVSGTSPFNYQWSRNGMAIGGATSSSYTTPATTSADNGAQFSVSVGNSAGGVTSGAATLTVSSPTLLLTLNPTNLSFGSVNMGSSVTKSVNVTNSGNSNVTISGVSYSGAGFIANGLGGQILAPMQSATLNVTFTPSAITTVSGSVMVTSNATNSPATVTLSGSGVQLVTHNTVLSWTQSTSTVTGYQVYSSATSGGPYNKLSLSAVNTPNYTDSAVQSGKTYYYVVTAVDATAKESSYSNQVSALIP